MKLEISVVRLNWNKPDFNGPQRLMPWFLRLWMGGGLAIIIFELRQRNFVSLCNMIKQQWNKSCVLASYKWVYDST